MHRTDTGRQTGDQRHRFERSSRRSVLKWTGAAFLSATAIGATLNKSLAQGAVDLGRGDVGVLNYAYALEQLEAAFYTQVTASPYGGMNQYEARILTDIRDHEIAHREFLKGALGRRRIPDLEVDFSAVNFSSRRSVLTTARTFEDLGVSAYNGAGQLLRNPDYLVAAGRIVSVEARHAATIRHILDPFDEDFAGDDIVDRNGLDVSRLPSQVLPLADPFIATPVSATQLP